MSFIISDNFNHLKPNKKRISDEKEQRLYVFFSPYFIFKLVELFVLCLFNIQSIFISKSVGVTGWTRGVPLNLK